MATSIKLDEDLRKRIQHLAEVRDRTSHWIMREAIKEYVAREEARESFKQEALTSWTSYQETGRHLTGQEVQSWLKTWGSKAEAKLLDAPVRSLRGSLRFWKPIQTLAGHFQN